MSLFTASLNSGSNGNSYYIANHETAVLIDVGISCKEVEKRIKRLGLSMRKIKAVFITHEHGDHIHGVVAISRKYNLPVYISQKTLLRSGLLVREDLTRFISSEIPIDIDGLRIVPFSKFHDAADPHSFIVSYAGISVGVFTDHGKACENTIAYFKQCHAAFLEANYDEETLAAGGYPQSLKDRITSDVGHLSNRQALQLFMEHRSEFLSHLFLSHLSRENNAPKLVKDLFENERTDTQIIVASRQRESKVFHIRQGKRKTNAVREDAQLSLF